MTGDCFVVTEMTNFCRVFELPREYPEKFCFNGPVPVTFNMIDWFNPVPREFGRYPISLGTETRSRLIKQLREFISAKDYCKPGRVYLVITDYGDSFRVTK